MKIIRDEYSRFTNKVYFLRSKEDIAEFYMVYLVAIATRKLEMVRSDGGGEGVMVPYVVENRLSRSLRLAIPQKSCGEDRNIRAVSERGFTIRREYVGGTS